VAAESLHNDVEFLRNTPTQKKIAVKNNDKIGLLFVNVPYSKIWQARVNGKDTPMYKANGAFVGIKIEEPQAEVELFVKRQGSFVALGISFITLLGIIIALFLSTKRTLSWHEFMQGFLKKIRR
jgi:uncharacterized membrane protein YfhO